MQLGLSRRRQRIAWRSTPSIRCRRSFGNTSRLERSAHRRQQRAERSISFNYDLGYNAFDVRNNFQRQRALLDSVRTGTRALGIRRLGPGAGRLECRRHLERAQRPADRRAHYAARHPVCGRTGKLLQQPGGGPHRGHQHARRWQYAQRASPDLVPGVDPFIVDGGVLFLNPAAFATPKPGTFGNLERGALHGPGSRKSIIVVSKKFPFGGPRNAEFRIEVFNLFNRTNFSNPVATLPNAIPTAATTEANKVQPGQAFTPAAAGTFGSITSTVGRTVGLGTSRQMQLAFRLNF